MAETKMIAINPSVAADGWRSTNSTIDSIPETDEDSKLLNAIHQGWQYIGDSNYLNTISMKGLFDSVYQSKPPIVDGLLHRGTYLFVGAPKLGKSFLMAQLAYHVSTGTSLWGHETHKGTVLYLALEDDYGRLQQRLYRMFGAAENENLFLAVTAEQLGCGLEDQLDSFLQEHRDTSLIIIDTLQKIRATNGDNYSYANDYQIIARLKAFADAHGICLIVVHHTRKQKADDAFDMISGTNGLLGAADGAFILKKEKRTANTATLEVSGRDQQDQRLHLIKDEASLCWKLDREETELWKVPPEPLLEEVAKRITPDNPQWTGSPTELCTYLDVDMKPNVLTQKLNVNAGRLMQEYGIGYRNKHGHAGRQITLSLTGA